MATDGQREALVKGAALNLNRALIVLQSDAPIPRIAELFNAIEGLLEIAEESLPPGFYATDRRVRLAEKTLGERM